MFTGLIQDLGTVEDVERTQDGMRLRIRGSVTADVREGDSVAVNGVCLTASAVADGSFSADVMAQTLRQCSLATAAPGASVNLELPLRASDRLGGHVVQGHVDGLGVVLDQREEGFARLLRIGAPAHLLRYVVEHGSIALDGISLTVAELGVDSFTVSLIPETLARTTLGAVRAGDRVNLEVDVLAKYVERLVAR
ncbi:MAG: riboflavin synthase [Actinomycetota bacterium]|nr:riboflavin synthase [Actinomycetota bacterium]